MSRTADLLNWSSMITFIVFNSLRSGFCKCCEKRLYTLQVSPMYISESLLMRYTTGQSLPMTPLPSLSLPSDVKSKDTTSINFQCWYVVTRLLCFRNPKPIRPVSFSEDEMTICHRRPLLPETFFAISYFIDVWICLTTEYNPNPLYTLSKKILPKSYRTIRIKSNEYVTAYAYQKIKKSVTIILIISTISQ